MTIGGWYTVLDGEAMTSIGCKDLSDTPYVVCDIWKFKDPDFAAMAKTQLLMDCEFSKDFYDPTDIHGYPYIVYIYTMKRRAA